MPLSIAPRTRPAFVRATGDSPSNVAAKAETLNSVEAAAAPAASADRRRKLLRSSIRLCSVSAPPAVERWRRAYLQFHAVVDERDLSGRRVGLDDDAAALGPRARREVERDRDALGHKVRGGFERG